MQLSCNASENALVLTLEVDKKKKGNKTQKCNQHKNASCTKNGVQHETALLEIVTEDGFHSENKAILAILAQLQLQYLKSTMA